MTRHHVFSSALLAAGVLLIAGCASQPASTTESLDDKYFHREANKLAKFEHEGQTIYCQTGTATGSLIASRRCISESALRQLVEDTRRSRNSVGYTQVRNRG
jgi:type IV pilus biogenesis protein CpaD/CtpE